MEIIINNWELILGVASIFIPALLPAKYASKVGIVLQAAKKIGDFAHKMETSKGGLTLKPEFEKSIKDEAFTKVSQVLASKTEYFDTTDVKSILTQMSKSKGVERSKDKLKDFLVKL